jgi:glycosyltransferase involved in cell wall biosynthesis
MRLCLELTAVCRPVQTGIARYARNLAEALIAENAARENPDTISGIYRLSRWPRRHLRLTLPGLRRGWIQEPWWPPRPPYDLVHGFDARVPAWKGVLKVATVHDLFVLHPEAGTPRDRLKHTMERYRRMARLSDRVICPSESTRRDFIERIGFPPERVDVVHLGVGADFAAPAPEMVARWRQEKELERAYILFVGEFGPRKNLPRLIRAYIDSGLSADYNLVCAGHDAGGIREALTSMLGRQRAFEHVKFPGHIVGPELLYLYAAASAFAFPTLYEGFGLPVLEAMACGTPVLTSNLGATLEIAGQRAVLADPYSVESIADGLMQVVAMTSQTRQAAMEYARTFSWAATANKTREVYIKACANGRQ